MSAAHGVIKQAFVDVADLLYVEGAEREAAAFGWSASWHAHLEKLQGFEQVQHGTIIDGNGLRLCIAPGCAGSAAF